MPSLLQSEAKKIPPEIAAEMARLRAECERFNRKGLHHTAHHETLARLEKEYGKSHL